MKKVLVLVLVLVFTLSMSLTAFAASDKGNNGKGKATQTTTAQASSKEVLKQFKQEMNTALQGQDNLQSDRDALQAQYDALKAAVPDPTDTQAVADQQAALDALQTQINDIDVKLANPEIAKKQLINERFMVIKSVKSGFNVMDYDSAEALVTAMNTGATDQTAWSITAHNNLIKLEAPAYIKGGKILFPLKALENIGAAVTWNENDKTITVTKDGQTVVFSASGTSATKEQAITDPAVSLTTDTATGSVTGTITGSITDPVSGTVTGNINFTVTGTSSDFVVDPATSAVTGTLAQAITVTGNITDPATGAIIGTVTGEVSGSLTNPTFTLTGSTSINTQVSTDLSCGRAYVPLKDLVQIFGIDVTADPAAGSIDVDQPDTTDDTTADNTGSTDTANTSTP